MTAPQFSRASGDPRLFWLDGATWGQSGGFCLVLFGAATGVPAQLSLSQSFSDYPGYYVILAKRPAAAAETAFVEAVLALGGQLGAGARFLWLPGPVRDPDWTRRVLYLQQTPGATVATIDRPTVFDVGRYRFSVSGGQTMAVTTDGFAVTGSVSPAFQLLTDDKAWPLVAGTTALSASAATAGCFQLQLNLDVTANPGAVNDYQLLDVGFRFGLVDAAEPLLLTSLHYPLFQPAAAGTIGMTMRFDPVGVLDPARTLLAYSGATAPMETHYTSQLGYPVTLAPDLTVPASPAGLAFHKTPRSLTEQAGDDPLYLAPAGSFTLAVGAPVDPGDPPAARLTGGISGSEYFGFSSGAGVPVVFAPGQPAFAASLPGVENADVVPGRQLTEAATTAYAAVGPPPGGLAWYFAQPDDGAFFHIRSASSDLADLIPYLVLLDLVSSDVTSTTRTYPLVPYAGAGGNDLQLVQSLESQILSPARRAALAAPPAQPVLPSRHLEADDLPGQAVTPQGILATFADNVLTSITLSPATAGGFPPQLAFNSPSATFRSALGSNQLFLVAANPVELMANCDFNYWITEAVLGDLARLSGAEAVPPTVVNLLRGSAVAREPQTSLGAFTTMLDTVLTGGSAQYRDRVIKYSMYFELAVEGWRFRLSPTLWADRVTRRPVLIFKYAAGSLRDFVQNTEAWAWPAVAAVDGSITATQTLVNDILDRAIAEVAEHGTSSSLYSFVTEIVSNPSWTGVVMLNADVPFSSVPPELAGLAAGVDAERFGAHHVGISVTPVAVDEPNRSLAQSGSTIFGLVDYEQLEDIAHIDGDFDFKVLVLRVLFANSAIADFAGRIELFVNRLFGEQVVLYNSTHYNNILLNGTYQRQGGTGHYVFATSEVSIYGAAGAKTGGSDNQVVLLQTEFDQAQFVTATQDTVSQPMIRNRFLLQGKLRFAGLHGFDAFSFGPTLDSSGVQLADGYLAFTSLSVDMDVPVNDPESRTFRLDLDEISFDPASSKARPTSFFQRFPLQVAGLVRGTAKQTPGDLGYLPLDTPISQPGFTGDWFGLVFAVDLGTLGALSSAPALSAAIVAAWCPTGAQHLVNIGLKLPGVESARSLLPVEGVLDLGFSSIDLQADGATGIPPDPAYVLRFRDFHLRFLGWKFPPGQNTIALFGNPEAASQSLAADRGALGWYAAYAKKESKE